jgi:hypothetical protein
MLIRTHAPVCVLALLALAGSAIGSSSTTLNLNLDSALASEAGQQPAAEAAPATTAPATKGGFGLSDGRFHNDPEILWPGFLTGMRGFEHFYEPIGNPLYFESPFVNSNIRALFLHHNFPENSTLQGGDVTVYAAQARLAITERLALIATKDGYSELDSGLLPDDEGWNDIAVGAKYAFIVDRENDFVLTGGTRWQWRNGDKEVLQGLSQELSPFIVVAKGFGDLKLIGNFTYRFGLDGGKGNDVAQWDISAAYDLSSVGLKGLAPMIELHGLHYTRDGKQLAIDVGGLDYSNIGANDVAGTSVVWMGVGGRWKLTPQVAIGATYEFSLTDKDEDIMDDRVTLDLILTW